MFFNDKKDFLACNNKLGQKQKLPNTTLVQIIAQQPPFLSLLS